MASTFLVHMDNEHGAVERVSLAEGLARLTGATLVGTAAGVLSLRPHLAPAGLWPGALEAERLELQHALEGLHDRFLGAGGARAVQWRAAMVDPDLFVSEQARGADLLVIGTGGGPPICAPLAADPCRLAVSVGRPIMLVPRGLSTCDLASVVVAWKDSREARRAVADALPLLRYAGRIVVAQVSPTPDESSLGAVAAYLASHGCSAEAKAVRDTDASAAEILVDIARDEGAGLIVSGAYGRSRAREWLLGGVTAELLAYSPVCCLMSH